MADYFNHFQPIFDDTEKEMDAQLLALYHDSRDGQIVRTIFFQDHRDEYGNMRVEETCFTKPDNITFVNRENFFTDDRQDCYLSLATFANGARRRASDNLYNRSTMYIDIDCHNDALSEEERDTLLLHAAGYLTEAYDNGVLPIPTFINHTGRGLACCYVLEHSINANISETTNALLVFQSMYARLIGLYAYVLRDCDAEVDTCVTDATRIMRVAGTKNTRNGKTCHMVYLQRDPDGSIIYVPSLRFFNDYLSHDIHNTLIRRGYNKEQSAIILTRRLNALTRLITLRKNDTEALRHMTLFVIYQTARAMQDADEAGETLYRCNFMYGEPLPERELLSIIASTERHIARKQNVYFYTNKRLTQMLGISDEEAKEIGFGNYGESKRQKERRELKERHQEERKERNNAIYALWKDGVSCRKIADQFGVTVRCIQMTVKKLSAEYEKMDNVTPEVTKQLSPAHAERETRVNEAENVNLPDLDMGIFRDFMCENHCQLYICVDNLSAAGVRLSRGGNKDLTCTISLPSG